MKKARFTLTVTVEWEINPEWYFPDIPLTGSDDERIAYDVENIRGSYDIIVGHDHAIFDLKSELIEEESK